MSANDCPWSRIRIMATLIRTHLMFDGEAQQAMTAYVSLFPDSEITELSLYTDGDNEGKVQSAIFRLGGQEFLCIDSPVPQAFGFTPAMSLFADFESADELEHAFAELSAGGEVLMPLGDYGFSRRFAWVSDRFGVSWQLSLSA